MSRENEAFGEKVKEVVSYEDDVFVWVYLDQVDRVIRYEAFVVGYDRFGERTTLDFVLEEGVLDNAHEIPMLWDLLKEYYAHPTYSHQSGGYTFTVDGRLVTAPSLQYFYRWLSPEDLQRVHAYFAEQEDQLKSSRRSRWIRMLKALGYDVIPSL